MGVRCPAAAVLLLLIVLESLLRQASWLCPLAQPAACCACRHSTLLALANAPTNHLPLPVRSGGCPRLPPLLLHRRPSPSRRTSFVPAPISSPRCLLVVVPMHPPTRCLLHLVDPLAFRTVHTSAVLPNPNPNPTHSLHRPRQPAGCRRGRRLPSGRPCCRRGQPGLIWFHDPVPALPPPPAAP